MTEDKGPPAEDEVWLRVLAGTQASSGDPDVVSSAEALRVAIIADAYRDDAADSNAAAERETERRWRRLQSRLRANELTEQRAASHAPASRFKPLLVAAAALVLCVTVLFSYLYQPTTPAGVPKSTAIPQTLFVDGSPEIGARSFAEALTQQDANTAVEVVETANRWYLKASLGSTSATLSALFEQHGLTVPEDGQLIVEFVSRTE